MPLDIAEPRRLRLSGLPGWARRLVVAGVAAWAGAAVLLVLLAVDVELPGPSETTQVGPISRVAVIYSHLALAMAAAALVVAARRSERRGREIVVLLIALLGAALGGQLVEVSDIAEVLDAGPASLVKAAGWLGLAASALLALAAFAGRRTERAAALLASWLAAAPFALSLLSFLLLTGVDTPEGVERPLSSLVAQNLVASVAGAGFALSLLFLWQATAGAGAARDVGVGLRRTAGRWKLVLPVAIAAKLTWLALGLLGGLPDALGGRLDAWEASRDDGVLSWCIAIVFAAGAGAALVLRSRARGPIDDTEEERQLPPVTFALVAGMTVALLVASVALLVVGVLGVAPASELRVSVMDAGLWAADRMLATQVLTVVAAGVAGMLLVRSRRHRIAGAFLLLFFVWALPRAADIVLAWGPSSGSAPGRLELTTLDATVSFAVAVLAARAWRRDDELLGALALVLATSTVLAHTGSLLSSVWFEGAFYFGLIFPTAYVLLFGAARLNRDRHAHPDRVVGAVGLAAGLLAVATVQLSSGFTSPDTLTLAALGRLLLAPPLAAVLAWLAITSLVARPSAGARPARAPSSPRGVR